MKDSVLILIAIVLAIVAGLLALLLTAYIPDELEDGEKPHGEEDQECR